MALNFPSSPTDGQIYYDATSGNRYVYDTANTLWKYASNSSISQTSNTQVLYNNSGVMGGSNGLTFSSNTLYVDSISITNTIATVNSINFNVNDSIIPPQMGELQWNLDDDTLDIGLANGSILQTGQETLYRVKNQSGGTILSGTVVRSSGTLGSSGRLLIAPFKANGQFESKYCIGVVTSDMLNGDDGYVTHFGKVRNIDTSAWPDGTILYANATSAGSFSTVLPAAPNNKITLAIVVHSDVNGVLFVRPTLGSQIHEDELCELTTLANGDVLVYNITTGRFENNPQTSLNVDKVDGFDASTILGSANNSANSANVYAGVMANAANATSNTNDAAGNAWSNTIGSVSNTWSNTQTAVANGWTNSQTSVANSWANTVSGIANNFAGTMANAANATSNTNDAAGNVWANTVASYSNTWANTVSGYSNTWANTVGGVSNTWSNTQTSVANGWTNSQIAVANSWANTVAGIANNFAGTMANAANATANTQHATGNVWANTVAGYSNTWANTVGGVSNTWANTVSGYSNTWSNTQGGISNSWANTVGVTANNFAGTMANAANAYASATYYLKTGGTVSGDMIVTGNLTVSGLTSYVNTTTLLIGDNILTLNADLPSTSAPTENAGMNINRGNLNSNAAILWDETADKWMFTSNDIAAITTYIASNTDVTNATVSANAYAGSMANSSNLWSNTVGGVSNTWANTKLSNTDGVTFEGSLTISANLTVTDTVFAQHFDNSSDIRLKENVAPINDPMIVISQLNPVSFNWISNGKKSFGLIAQEVETVLPEVINIREDGIKTLSYIDIISFLIAAVKQQQEDINRLNSKIDSLYHKNA